MIGMQHISMLITCRPVFVHAHQQGCFEAFVAVHHVPCHCPSFVLRGTTVSRSANELKKFQKSQLAPWLCPLPHGFDMVADAGSFIRKS